MKKFISVGLFGVVMLISGLVIGKTVVGSSWGGTKIGAHSEHITLDHVGDSYQLPGEKWRLLDDAPTFSINQDGVITASGEGSARIVYEAERKTIYSSVKVDEFPDWGEYKQIESNVSILGQFDHPYDVEQMKFTATSEEYFLHLILLSNAGNGGNFMLFSDEEVLLSISFNEMEKAGDTVSLERTLHLETGKTYYISLSNDLYFDLLTSYAIDLTPIF